jgi:hypothetical protein
MSALKLKILEGNINPTSARLVHFMNLKKSTSVFIVLSQCFFSHTLLTYISI